MIHRQIGCRVFTTVALMMVTGFTMMCVRVAMAWEGGLARSMRGILVAVVIVMPAVPNRRCGVKADRVVTGFLDAGLYKPQEWCVFQDYGRVLHDQAIYGVKPEGKLSVEYTYETFTFPDGEKYELCRPAYSISEWYADSIKPEDMFCTVRIPLRHVGMGQ